LGHLRGGAAPIINKEDNAVRTYFYRQSDAARKPFVKAVSGILEVRPRYIGIPRYAYEVGFATITREGNIEVDDNVDREQLEELIEKLSMMGYEAEGQAVQETQPTDEHETTMDTQPAESTQPTENTHPIESTQPSDEPQTPTEEAEINVETEETLADGEIAMTITLSRSVLTDSGLENLRKLIYAKDAILRMAFDIDTTEIEVTDEAISFPWFGKLEPEELKYVSQFLCGMCRFANKMKRVTSKRRGDDNPKFAMRVWAIRMGFSGEKYRGLRKYLMHRLPGDSAFRFGRPEDQITKEDVILQQEIAMLAQ